MNEWAFILVLVVTIVAGSCQGASGERTDNSYETTRTKTQQAPNGAPSEVIRGSVEIINGQPKLEPVKSARRDGPTRVAGYSGAANKNKPRAGCIYFNGKGGCTDRDDLYCRCEYDYCGCEDQDGNYVPLTTRAPIWRPRPNSSVGAQVHLSPILVGLAIFSLWLTCFT